MDDFDGPVRSPDEIRRFLEQLSETEELRLLAWARIYAAGTGIQPEQLLGDAVTRALAGERRCRTDLSIMVFFKSTLRSLVSAELEAVWNRRVESLADDIDDSQIATHAAVVDDPERNALARDALNQLLAAFDDDSDAQNVLICKASGVEGAEAQKETGLNPVEYASAMRKVRRTLDKLYPDGWQ